MPEVTDEGSGSLAEATKGFISTMGVDEPSEEITEESIEESEELEAEQTEDSEEVLDESEEFETEETVEANKYFLPIGEDGSDVEIAEDDVKNYILMQSDYTKKTQTLAEERKALEQERNSIRAIQNLSEQLQQQYEGLRQAEEAERSSEYWEQLKAENPMQYMVERQELQDRSREREQQEQKVFALQQQLQEQQRLEHQHRLVSEAQKLQEMIPEWIDQTTADREKQELMVYGRSQNYSPDELNAVSDSRAITILRKAMLWDRLQSNKDNLKQKALQKPASASAVRNANAPKRKMSGLKKAQLKLHKSGSIQDATSAFEQVLNIESRR
tara:strand:- start:4246 stop:5232 length:987 start_codon:yes stop_codon:yes gene_type:complete